MGTRVKEIQLAGRQQMKKVKVLSVFGTRPEAIKMAPLIKEIEKDESLESLVCVTAQHRDMLDQVMDIFDLKANVDLDIMQKSQTLTDITTRALIGLEGAFKALKPDLVLVHGDTTTTFAAGLAAFYSKIAVGHVEAGLRTYDKYQPFPEEMNRKLTTALADLYFAPTPYSRNNLLKENIPEENVFVTGNTAIDCLSLTISDEYEFMEKSLNHINFEGKRIITMTAHRRENIGEPLEAICKAVKRIVEDNEDIEVIYPVHSNPAVRETAERILDGNKRIHLLNPLDIKDMHNLMNKSYFVMTDSGGLQEEVPSMGKPVLVLRNVTERPEGVEAGTLKIAGVEEDKIYEMASTLLHDEKIYSEMAIAKNPFGDGFASRRIVEAIKYHFGIINERPLDYTVNQLEN